MADPDSQPQPPGRRQPAEAGPTRSSRRSLIVNYGKVFLSDPADRERMTLEFVREKVLITDGQTPF